MPAPSTDSTSASSRDSASRDSLQASSPRLSSGQAGQVPSQSLRQFASWRREQEFNRRRALIEYTLCNDEDIWAEMEKEKRQAKLVRKQAREKAKKPKPLVTHTTSQLESINVFLLDTFRNYWGYNQEQLAIVRQNLKPEMISPDNIDWDQRRKDKDTSKSGHYTLNPETQNLNFEKARVFIPDPDTLKQFQSKPRADVAKHIQITYGSKYHIPGIEYWEYILQNPDKASQSLKDSKNRYFYFGSILRHRNGYWCVPFSLWDGSSFQRYAFWLNDNWYSNYRVVLLEK